MIGWGVLIVAEIRYIFTDSCEMINISLTHQHSQTIVVYWEKFPIEEQQYNLCLLM